MLGTKKFIVDEGQKGLLAWKCEKEDFEFGTRLTVHESQQAVFFRDGGALEVLPPGLHILETSNFPFLRRLVQGAFGRKYYHCEVYFINQSVHMAVNWGTRRRVNVMLEVEDGKPLPLSVGASGSMNIQADPDQPLKLLTYLLGTGRELTAAGMQEMFRDMVDTLIKSHLARVIQQQHMNAFTLDQHLDVLSGELKNVLAPEFKKYGLLLREFYLVNFALPEDDPAFQEARLLHQQRYARHGHVDLEGEIELKKAGIAAQKAQIQAEQTLTEATAASQANVIAAQGEAARRSLEGITSIQEHQFDILGKAVEAGGQGSGSPLVGDMTGMMSDAMKMGMGFQMAKNAGDMMQDMMGTAPFTMAASPQPEGWLCSCGARNTGNFCGACGKPRPRPQESWTCTCGAVNTGNFCSECGKPKPRPPAPWTCACGQENGPESKFCSNCGGARP